MQFTGYTASVTAAESSYPYRDAACNVLEQIGLTEITEDLPFTARTDYRYYKYGTIYIGVEPSTSFPRLYFYTKTGYSLFSSYSWCDYTTYSVSGSTAYKVSTIAYKGSNFLSYHKPSSPDSYHWILLNINDNITWGLGIGDNINYIILSDGTYYSANIPKIAPAIDQIDSAKICLMPLYFPRYSYSAAFAPTAIALPNFMIGDKMPTFLTEIIIDEVHYIALGATNNPIFVNADYEDSHN